MKLESLQESKEKVQASKQFLDNANFKDPNIYKDALSDNLAYWKQQANQLSWIKPFKNVLEWGKPHARWFVDGKLNVATNCLDVHLDKNAHKTAILWENETGQQKRLSYLALTQAVNRLAHVFQSQFNLHKGDRVTLYMPMIPELVIGVLACARLGLIHSVVFGGFSSNALKERLIDSESRLLITADGVYRKGRLIPLKKMADEALESQETKVESVLVVKYLGDETIYEKMPRDIDYDQAVQGQPSHIDDEVVDSEDTLFILYTSGTTGKPKGIMHSSAGYLTHAKSSTKLVFDLKEEDVYWCSADIGWITGHTYLIYGPLSNGATVFMYEGTPDYPQKDCFWKLIDKHKISIFYTAPTAIRAFMKWGEKLPNAIDLSSLRLLGTVGEPINPDAWYWYYKHIGKSRCPIVDTWWQTETGGIMISTLPSIHPMKPGCAGHALPGISASILNEEGKKVSNGAGYLSITKPWPSMLRGIWGDEQRYVETYWSKFDSYFAGDGAVLDQDGYFKVLGRVDDVLNVSGHRIGTMEIESALVQHPAVAEAAVVGMPDEIKGQAIVAFVMLKTDALCQAPTETELIAHVAEQISVIAKPKKIILTQDLPKTRSGKIMRRILKALVHQTDLGDCSTLANPECVQNLATHFTKLYAE